MIELTEKEKHALHTLRDENSLGNGIWTRALEDYNITRYTMNKLEKKGLVYREISGDSGHSLYWVNEKLLRPPNFWF